MGKLWCVLKQPKMSVGVPARPERRDLDYDMAMSFAKTLSHDDPNSYYSVEDQEMYDFRNRNNSRV